MDSQKSFQLAKMKNSSQEARDYAFKMEAVKKNLMPPVDKPKKLREACEGFESIFIQKMWEQMRATIPESGLLKGREEKFWQSMYDQELAKTMAGAGGIGLADMMYEQLSRNLRAASKDTADALGGQPSGFAAQLTPAPLVRAHAPQTQPAAASAEASAQQQKKSALAGLYSEARQPEAPGEPARHKQGPAGAALSQAAASPASNAAQSAPEDGTDPAIMGVLRELRAAHQADSSMNGQHSGHKGLSLGAHPPLPPAQEEVRAQAAEAQQGKATYITTLTKPVHKPAAGKRTVLPRAMSGSRVPTGQPVNRNLPFARQETQQAQAPPSDPAGAVPAPASSGQSSAGVEALNAFAARQKAAQLTPGAVTPDVTTADRPQAGG